jgi:hypothetical protein
VLAHLTASHKSRVLQDSAWVGSSDLESPTRCQVEQADDILRLAVMEQVAGSVGFQPAEQARQRAFRFEDRAPILW